MIEFVIVVFLAYLIGSVPSAVWIGKAYHGIDVRGHGSMNAGATNTFRVLGKRSGIFVLLLDMFKGFTATNLIHLFPNANILDNFIGMKVILGLLSVVGHIYPMLAGFRGGKGIASLLGMVLAINPLLALGVILVFFLVHALTHMISAGSIAATASFTIFVWIFYGYREPVLILFGICATLLVLYTHRSNVKRILAGNEKRIYFSKSRKEAALKAGKVTE